MSVKTLIDTLTEVRFFTQKYFYIVHAKMTKWLSSAPYILLSYYITIYLVHHPCGCEQLIIELCYMFLAYSWYQLVLRLHLENSEDSKLSSLISMDFEQLPLKSCCESVCEHSLWEHLWTIVYGSIITMVRNKGQRNVRKMSKNHFSKIEKRRWPAL